MQLLTQAPIPDIFAKKKLRIGGIEKLSFFESAILNFFFQKKFSSSHQTFEI